MAKNFSHAALINSHAIALIDHAGRQATYSDIRELSFKAGFNGLGGSLILCLVENEIDCLSGYLAMLTNDAVLQVVSADILPETLDELIGRYRPSCLWVPTVRLSKIDYLGRLAEVGAYSLVKMGLQVSNINPGLGLLLSTSGTTGSAKFVRLSKNAVLANAKSIKAYLSLSENDVPVTTLPPAYSFGLSIIHSHFLAGAKLFVTDKTFIDKRFWNDLSAFKITSLSGVPYHFEMLQKLGFTQKKIPYLNKITQAGGKLAPNLAMELANYAKKNAISFFLMYGQTEASPRMSFLAPEKVDRKPASIGSSIPGTQMWLQDDHGKKICKPQQEGELIFSGENVFWGYASGYEDLARGDEVGGVLHTGDLAVKDEEGDFYIIGRMSRFVKIYGLRINLDDVERLLKDHGYEAACVGNDTQITAFCVGVADDKIRSLRSFLTKHLRLSPRAVEVISVKDLEKTASGKISYHLLQTSTAASYDV